MIKRAGPMKKKGSAPKFVYQKRSADSVKERAEQTGGRFDGIFVNGVDTFRPKEGSNHFRILPPTWEDHDHYGLDVWVHQYVSEQGNYLCLQKMLQKPCPICKAAKECKDAGEADEAKALEPKKQVVVYLINRDDKKPAATVYPMSWTMDRDIANLCHNEKTGKTLLIDHPDEGYDVALKRIGQGLKTRYSGIAIDRETSPVSDDPDEQDEILEYISDNPIPSLLKYQTADYLEKVVEGSFEEKEETEDGEDDQEDTRSRTKARKGRDREEDEETRPARRGRSSEQSEEDRPRKSRKVTEDEGEEEDGEDRRTRRERDMEAEGHEVRSSKRSRRSSPEEEEEEEERPVKKGNGKVKRARLEEEEEEEEPAPKKRRRPEPEEEEEEEEPPRRRAKREEPEDEPDEGARKASRRRPEPEEEEEEERPRRRSRRDRDEDVPF